MDRFTGPFGAKTKVPILFIANTYDPITPITGARRVALKYPESQILTIDGMGHASIGPRNGCAFKKMADYLQHGILPGKDSYCKLEKGPFGVQLNQTLEEVVNAAL